MELSTVFTKLTCAKTRVFGVLGGLTLAGAALMFATPAAQAQHFGIAVQLGGPQYVQPAPVYSSGYYAPGEAYYGYTPAAPAYYGNAYVAAPGYWRGRDDDDWREHHEGFRRGDDWGEHRGWDHHDDWHRR